MTQYAFLYDHHACTGCKTCEMACKDYYDLGLDIAYRKIYDYEGGTCTYNGDGTVRQNVFMYHVTLACNHCDKPACVAACPTGAMHKDADTGLVTVDADRCIGCGYCVMACPYDAPRVDREAGHSVKCSGCAERVAEGKQPICVEACPLRALHFGPVDEMEPHGIRANIAPLPTPDFTNPNLFIQEAANARPAGSTDGMITNPKEVR